MPVGGLILGTNFFIIGKDYISIGLITELGMIFWSLCTLMALGLGIFVIFNMMISEEIGPEVTNFSWFITPVASIVIPLLGNQLVKVFVEKTLS